jgi:hypothetical protein
MFPLPKGGIAMGDAAEPRTDTEELLETLQMDKQALLLWVRDELRDVKDELGASLLNRRSNPG